jgi:hypothetical protein
MKRFWLILASILGLAATAMPASAALQYTYTLKCDGTPCTGSAGNNNYGTVTLLQHGSDQPGDPNSYVTVTVQLASGYTFAGSNAGYAIAWDITNAPDLSSVTVTSSNKNNFTVQDFKPSVPGYDGRYKSTPFTSGSCGKTTASCFEYAIDYDINGSQGNDSKLVFDVKKSNGLILSNFAANSGGYTFAVDIANDCGDTFVVASTTSHTTVPEPATWATAIAGLGFLFMLQRRRKLVRG